MAKSTAHIFYYTPANGVRQYNSAWHTERWQPRVDVYQTEAALVVVVEAPGVPQTSLEVHYEPGQLVVQGQRERPIVPTPARCLQVEMDHGAFRRELALPANVDGDGISASYEDGLLVITLPFSKPSPQHSIRVSVG